MPNSMSDMNEFSKIAAKMLVASQTATLRMLAVEMQGLVRMIPGAICAAAERLPSDDEVEQGFENMPV